MAADAESITGFAKNACMTASRVSEQLLLIARSIGINAQKMYGLVLKTHIKIVCMAVFEYEPYDFISA